MSGAWRTITLANRARKEHRRLSNHCDFTRVSPTRAKNAALISYPISLCPKSVHAAAEAHSAGASVVCKSEMLACRCRVP